MGLLDKIKKYAKANVFIRRLIPLMTGTLISQVILMASSPVLTRLYSAKEFGLFSVYASIMAILAIIASGKYEMAIVISKFNKAAVALSILSFTVLILFLLIAPLIVILVATLLNGVIQLGRVDGQLIALIALGVFFSSSFQILKYYSFFISRYKLVSIAIIAQSSANVLFSVLFYYGGLDNKGLIYASIGSYTVSVLIVALTLKKSRYRKAHYLSLRKIKYVMSKYQRFPRIMVFSGLLNVAAKEGPKLLISAFYGVSALGFFYLAQRMIQVPIGVIASSTQGVFFKVATEDYQKGSASSVFNSVALKLAIVGAIPAVIGFFSAPSIFEFVFGESWRMAGEIAKNLIPFYYVYFIVAPLNIIFVISERQKLEFLWQSTFFILSVGSIFFSHVLELELIDAVKIFSLAGTMVFLLSFFICKSLSRNEIRNDL